MSDSKENSLSVTEDSFDELNDTLQYTQNLRRFLLDKITPVVSAAKFDTEFIDGELINNQIKFIEQTRQLLNDLDTASKNYTNLRLKQDAISEQHSANVNIAEILSKVNLVNKASWSANDPNCPGVDNEQELNEVLKKITKDEEISDDELIISGGSLPVDRIESAEKNNQ